MVIHLSVGRRLALGFLLMIVLVLAASGVGLSYTASVEKTIGVTNEGLRQVENVSELQIAWLDVVATVDNMLLTRQTGLIEDRLAGNLDNFNRQLAAIQAGILGQTPQTSADNQQIVAELQLLGDELTNTVDKLVAVAQAGQWARAQAMRHTELASLQRRLQEGLDQLSANARSSVNATVADSVRLQQNLRTYWLLAAGFSLLAGVTAGALTWRSITRPIGQLTQRVQQVTQRDFSPIVPLPHRDEIGDLSRSFALMTDWLRESYESLEQQVADRTRDLQRRAMQIETAADVGRAAASILELEALTRQVVELIRDRFDLYYAGLFLVDAAGEYAVLEAGSGEAGRLMKERGHRLAVGGVSMVGSACAQKRARLALGVGAEPVRFDNPLLPDTRSEMALPLLVGDRVLGALGVQSTRPAAFSEEDIAVLQLVADQVAVAVDNARKFLEEAALVEATNPLFRVSRRLTAATTTNEVAQAIIASVAETEADRCAVAQFAVSPAGEVVTVTFLAGWSRAGRARFPIGVPLPARASMFPLPMQGEFWTLEDVPHDPRVPAGTRQTLAQDGVLALANVPLRLGDRPIGFVSIGRATTGPWSPVAVRLYETLADQAAVALERARLLEEAQQRAGLEHTIRDLSDRVTASFDLDTILQTTLEGLGAMLGAGGGFVELGVSGGRTPPPEARVARPEERV